jgi:hypothetical protein
MLKRSAVLVCSVLIAVTGCSAFQSGSGASKKGGAWREIRTPHFVLRTDGDSDDARRALAEFETAYEVLHAILFAGDPGAATPMRVVLFEHGADLHQFIPAGAVAAFYSPPPNDPDGEAVMLLETSVSDEARRMFVHEMTHAFIARCFSQVPIWLNEGLAEYFETIRIESGRAVVGDPVHGYEISANQMPSLGALLRADAATFYAGRQAHSVEGSYQQTSYYVGAWYLVHMFMHAKGEYRGRFHDFLDALKRREAAASAWARSFDEAVSRRLAADYLEYQRTDSLEAGFVAIDLESIDRRDWVERSMTAEEVQRLWGRLRRVAQKP